jgi:2-methylisocitrate lyase-like PEP mutase family enzyme
MAVKVACSRRMVASTPMNPPRSTPSAAVLAFRALHESGCFVLPNPWDVGTAVVLHQLGFKALATTSAGMAFARCRGRRA